MAAPSFDAIVVGSGITGGWAAKELCERGRPPFFHLMKWVTVYGYCTSEVGATAELHYEVIPGSYDGCTELGRSNAGPGDF